MQRASLAAKVGKSLPWTWRPNKNFKSEGTIWKRKTSSHHFKSCQIISNHFKSFHAMYIQGKSKAKWKSAHTFLLLWKQSSHKGLQALLLPNSHDRTDSKRTCCFPLVSLFFFHLVLLLALSIPFWGEFVFYVARHLFHTFHSPHPYVFIIRQIQQLIPSVGSSSPTSRITFCKNMKISNAFEANAIVVNSNDKNSFIFFKIAPWKTINSFR